MTPEQKNIIFDRVNQTTKHDSNESILAMINEYNMILSLSLNSNKNANIEVIRYSLIEILNERENDN
jgi:hypothetical protein